MATIEKPYKIPSDFGTNYVIVEGKGTPTQNAAELSLAVNKATGMAPSLDNIITIVIMPGKYDFGSGQFGLSYQFINYTSISGEPNVFIYNDNSIPPIYNDTDTTTAIGLVAGKSLDPAYRQTFHVPSGSIECVFQNCVGGSYSFGYSGDGDYYNSNTFINCKALDFSFGCSDPGSVYNYGTYINCESRHSSFGYTNGSGTVNDFGYYENCKAVSYSFACPLNSVTTATVEYHNCKATDRSFSPFGKMTGYWYYCQMTNDVFSYASYGLTGCIYYSVNSNIPISICGSAYYY